MIIAVYFHNQVTAFEHRTPCDEWIIGDQTVQNYGVTCTDKGNALVFEWDSKLEKIRGRRKRLRVPLTNVRCVLELDDPVPEKKLPEKPTGKDGAP